MSTDDERQARLAEIRRRHRAVEENVAWAGICVTCDEQEPCDAMTLLSELDAWKARAERAEAALSFAERNSTHDLSGHGSDLLRMCRICDQVGERGQIDHAPDCPFAATAAAPEARE